MVNVLIFSSTGPSSLPITMGSAFCAELRSLPLDDDWLGGLLILSLETKILCFSIFLRAIGVNILSEQDYFRETCPNFVTG